jgi:flagella basal body P-ring formation protein FlgA
VVFALSFANALAAGTVQDAVREAVAVREGVPLADVDVSGIGDLPNAPREADWAVTLPASGSVTGTVRVTVRAGALRYGILPHVVVWRELPVAAADVAAGAPVAVQMARVSSDLLGGAAVDPSGAWTARVPLEAGEPLTAVNVRATPDIARGTPVRIVSDQGLVSVSAPGKILDDGMVGDRVAVLNLATRAVQSGTYRGDATVSLEQR